MPSEIPDPFPTQRLSVPNLAELLMRLRNQEIRNCITVVHAKKEGEGEWICANAAARLQRGKIKLFGPSPGTLPDVVEHGLRTDAKIIFAGEMRRDSDGASFRKAAAHNVRPVGVITCIRLGEARMLLETMGPWLGYDVALLTTDLK